MKGGGGRAREQATPLRIAVCGGGAAGADACALAEQVGKGIAEAGAVLVCGGRGGVMEAAARGAAAAGGVSIGLLPGDDVAAANRFLTFPLPTGLGDARNVLVVRVAEAVIAIDGEWGTLSEVAFCGVIGRPVVLLRPTLTRGLGIEEVATPAEAVRWAVRKALDARRAAGVPIDASTGECD